MSLPANFLAVGDARGFINLWSYYSWKCVSSIHAHDGEICCITTLRNGRLVSGSTDKTIKLWNYNGTTNWILTGHTGPVKALVELKDGVLASASSDKTVRIWYLKGVDSANSLMDIFMYRDEILALAAFPNGDLIHAIDQKILVRRYIDSQKYEDKTIDHFDATFINHICTFKNGDFVTSTDTGLNFWRLKINNMD